MRRMVLRQIEQLENSAKMLADDIRALRLLIEGLNVHNEDDAAQAEHYVHNTTWATIKNTNEWMDGQRGLITDWELHGGVVEVHLTAYDVNGDLCESLGLYLLCNLEVDGEETP